MEDLIKNYVRDKDKELVPIFLEILEIINLKIDRETELMIQYGMPSFSVPFSKYPEGYLQDTSQPLPYISLAIHKNYVSLYNMCFVENQEVYHSIVAEYEKRLGKKINKGKSCVRFNKGIRLEKDLIESMIKVMDVDTWIKYNRVLKTHNK